MKKYQQLLIVSLGLVSFVCFLIYKHEYDRLRSVIEVLEVFGNPPSPIPVQDNGQIRHAAALAAEDLPNANADNPGGLLHNVEGRNVPAGNENVIPNPGNSGEIMNDEEENTGIGVVERANYPLKGRKAIHNSVFGNTAVKDELKSNKI